jgi:protoheme ferro-lyase
MTVREIYDRTIKPLPPADRLQLATLILNDIPPQSVVDYSEEWSDEDLRDFTRATWAHIDRDTGSSARPTE